MSDHPNDTDEDKKKAVALEYTRGRDEAPMVIASGQGTMAEQIIEIAKAHDIEIKEDADLVKILETVDVGSPIPLEAFTAVAEILAYLYQTNATLRDKRLSQKP